MLTEDQLRTAAQAILTADETKIPTPQVSKLFPDITIADAYRVQDIWAEALWAKGQRSSATRLDSPAARCNSRRK